jgi:bud site selection protein 31
MAPRWGKKKAPPPGFDYVEPILEALENELRDKVKESNEGKRKTESLWPVHQINWQKSRYIYDLFYTYKRISRQVYDYCIDQKLVDAALIAKWKKPGYERLCSTYVINPTNYKFGTTSICRVPLFDRSEEQRAAQDPTVRADYYRSWSVKEHFISCHGSHPIDLILACICLILLVIDWVSRMCVRQGCRTSELIWQQVWSKFSSSADCT